MKKILLKKIELWFLILLFFLMILITVLFGSLVRQELVGTVKFGWVSKAALVVAETPRNLKIIYNYLGDIGHDFSNNRHKKKKKFDKKINAKRNELLLLSRYDGDIKQSVVEIIDLNNFKKLHSFNFTINEYNKNITNKALYIDQANNLKKERFRYLHPLLLEDGSILFNHISPLYSVNLCGELKWINDDFLFHHSKETDHEGNIWTSITQRPTNQEIADITVNSQFNDDGLAKITPSGKIIYKQSISKILMENNLLDWSDLFNNDPIHSNDVEPILSDGKFWKKGQVFISIRNKSMILHFDPIKNKVLKIIKGPFQLQHDVDIYSNEEILIFNNNSLYNEVKSSKKNQHSEILIYNYKTDKYRKYNDSKLKKLGFFTSNEGLQDMLKDGSLLVEEQNHGRILFFDKFGNLEWEYVNKAKNGKIYITNWSRLIKDDNLVALVKSKIKKLKCTN